MSRAPSISAGRMEKAAAGWIDGMNSSRSGWLIKDTQYQFGVNVVNRGGIVQTRPGYAAKVSLPPGNLQGGFFFTPTKSSASNEPYIVVMVDGKVYALPFPLTQPASNDFTPFLLTNLQFLADAPRAYFEVAEKSATLSSSGELLVVPTYRILLIQDGISDAGYWDGEINTHSDELQQGIPKGTWMKVSGGRVHIARGTYLLSSDYLDPITFSERIQVDTDFVFDDDITGLENSVADTRQASLIVAVANSMYTINTAIKDRNSWLTSSSPLVSTLYPSIGAAAGNSFVNHAGLLWWHDGKGILNSDIAAATYLTSKINYRDVEMSRVKIDMATNVSEICSASFSNYLLCAVPIADSLNSMIFVLDSSVADELGSESSPAWSSLWTGIRPKTFIRGEVNDETRIFALSNDYVELDGSCNRIWELFQSNRRDSYERVTVDNVRQRVYNQIYCAGEFKQLGDGRDMKKFQFAEADLVEIGGTVNLKISFAGNYSGYTEILSKTIVSTMTRTNNTEVQALYDALNGQFLLQKRRVTSETAHVSSLPCESVESDYNKLISPSFSLYFQWCGRMGIEAFRIFMEPIDEPSDGKCEEDEDGLKILTIDGASVVPSSGDSLEETTDWESPRLGYASPISQKFRNIFYSSIPVEWQDIDGKCITCLPCARDTFTAPTKQDIVIDGETIY